MLCPVDGTTLVMAERSGVEIADCPKCRGVWLDRGELDKILDRAAAELPRAPAPGPVPTPVRPEGRRPEPVPEWQGRSHRVRDDRREERPRRRERFLSDLLDF